MLIFYFVTSSPSRINNTPFRNFHDDVTQQTGRVDVLYGSMLLAGRIQRSKPIKRETQGSHWTKIVCRNLARRLVHVCCIIDISLSCHAYITAFFYLYYKSLLLWNYENCISSGQFLVINDMVAQWYVLLFQTNSIAFHTQKNVGALLLSIIECNKNNKRISISFIFTTITQFALTECYMYYAYSNFMHIQIHRCCNLSFCMLVDISFQHSSHHRDDSSF